MQFDDINCYMGNLENNKVNKYYVVIGVFKISRDRR